MIAYMLGLLVFFPLIAAKSGPWHVSIVIFGMNSSMEEEIEMEVNEIFEEVQYLRYQRGLQNYDWPDISSAIVHVNTSGLASGDILQISTDVCSKFLNHTPTVITVNIKK